MRIINLKLTSRERKSLPPCPFCGGRELSLENTHTACYHVHCDSCGAEAGGDYVYLPNLRRAHALAKRRAIAAWRRRDGTNAVGIQCAKAALASAISMIVRSRLKVERPDLLAACSVALGELRGAYEGPVGKRRLKACLL